MNQTKQWWYVLFLLFPITILGFILRIHNISAFNVYPDSYQSLLVAKNLNDYHSVLGLLGTDGYLFPPYFMWTRPMYPFLINFVSLFTEKLFAARLISFSLGLFAIPLVFFVLQKVFNSKSIGACGSFLLALSFLHTVWGGFVMTETVGVFFMLVFLYFLFSEKNFANIIPAGFFLSLSVLTRYEYAVIVLPVLLYLYSKGKFSVKETFFLLVSFFLPILVVFFLFFPLDSLLQTVVVQNQSLLTRGGLVAAVLLVFLFAWKYTGKQFQTKFLPTVNKGVQIGIAIFVIFLLSQMFLGPSVPLYQETTFFRNFLKRETLIAVFSITGLILFLRNREYQSLSYFVLLSCFSLAILYLRVNPEMDRYMTHLLPFLLIPASYTTVEIGKHLQWWLYTKRFVPIIAVSVFLLILLIYQILTSYQGLRYLSDPTWYHTSYAEKSAMMVKKIATNHDLLIAAYPEPYYFVTGIPTQSISDTYPYIYLPNAPRNQMLLIIDDMPMKNVFPHFSRFLKTKLQNYKLARYFVGRKFLYVSKPYSENIPVSIFKIPLVDLENILQMEHGQ